MLAPDPDRPTPTSSPAAGSRGCRPGGCPTCCWRGSTGRSAPGCCSCPGCGRSCWRARRRAATVWLIALFAVGSVPDARRRLRGQRHVGPRHRPPGHAHRRPAAGLRRAAAAPGAGVPGGAAARQPADPAATRPLAQVLGVASLLLVAALSAGQARDLVAATDDRLHLRLRRADGLRRRHRAVRLRPGRALRAAPSSGSSARHDLRPPGPRGRRAGRRALHRPAVRRAHPAVPGRLLRRDGRCCWRWPAGWPGCAGCSTSRCCCRRRCWRGRSSRSTSTIRRCACACSRPTGRSGWRSGWPSCSAGCDAAPARVHPRQHDAGRAPLVPEIALHLATEITPIWQATEDWLRGPASRRRSGPSPGRAARRWRGTCWTIRSWSRAGACWISPPAAASPRSPARGPAPRLVEAAEIDPLAAAAIRLNAAANGVR